jgi:RNA polymerase sigma-70 factor (ECF subfamily)
LTAAPDERAAFTAVLKRHDAAMRGLAFRLLGDRHWMDDALQDAYLRAYRARHTLRTHDQVGSWLYRIVYNACIDELRRKRRRPVPVEVTTAAWDRPNAGATPDEQVADADMMRRALANLPDEQRATVVLVDGEGMSNATAAEILGVAPGTIASRLSRARHALRLAIGENR